MSHIVNLFNRIVEVKMKHQKLVDQINNRHKEQLPGPLFWIGVLCVMILLTTNVLAADAALMIKIIECESSGHYDAVGDDGISYGIAQFRRETFEEFAKEAGFKGLIYKNPIHQLKVMNWALDHNYGRRWTCYRKLTK